MAPSSIKKRKIEDATKGRVTKPAKKIRKQRHYDSDTEEDRGADGVANGKAHSTGANSLEVIEKTDDSADGGVQVASSEDSEDFADEDGSSASEATDASGPDSDSDTSKARSKKRKRNDPEAFATSMSKILGSKLTTTKRADPVLSRSKTAAAASQELSNSRLEAKARHKLREDKKSELDRGRVRDVLGLDASTTNVEGAEEGATMGETLEQEKRLRKTAQRGVVKLFNAVRAAQVKGEEAAREARKGGVIGQGKREAKVNEMSKKGFLDLISGSGGGGGQRNGRKSDDLFAAA
ncbi:MAG: hypothetical protein M1812_001372 [Candelaria pacifica]|nr:MAG: hypothetical protein M1812_001372 [Candelaria pacifica]